MKDLLEELKNLVLKESLIEGINTTNIPSMIIFKSSNITKELQTVYEPSLFVILQGAKIVTIGKKIITYDNSSFLISSTYLPISGRIVKASENEPFLSFKISFTLEEIFEAIKEFSITLDKNKSSLALCSYKINEELLDTVFRLFKLSKKGKDIETLLKMYKKELLYHLLITNKTIELLQLSFIEGNAYKISKAISFMNKDLYESLSIEEIAKRVNMSVSNFFKYFKTFTALTPLQYRKIQKLQEARRLMITQNMDISGAAFQVGYLSNSQFSREYTSYFGINPSLDIKNIKKSGIALFNT